MRLNILIVEDDPIQAGNLARLIEARGHYVDLVDNGRDAVRRISTGMFQVALIDYRLPEIDGLGIARIMRNLPGSFDRPRLVALTSAPQDLAAYAAEFAEILAKPVVAELLFQAIECGHPAEAVPDAAAPAADRQHFLAGMSADVMPVLPGASTGTRGRILVADDDPDLREFLRLTLESRGFAVDVAEDGLEAIRRIGTCAYDVVVVDFRMPNLDGLAAAKIIYDLTERQSRPRIVALTSTPGSLIAQDQRWHLVLDEVVSKASGVPAILLAVENCVAYKMIRSEAPLESFGSRTLTALMQDAGMYNSALQSAGWDTEP